MTPSTSRPHLTLVPGAASLSTVAPVPVLPREIELLPTRAPGSTSLQDAAALVTATQQSLLCVSPSTDSGAGLVTPAAAQVTVAAWQALGLAAQRGVCGSEPARMAFTAYGMAASSLVPHWQAGAVPTPALLAFLEHMREAAASAPRDVVTPDEWADLFRSVAATAVTEAGAAATATAQAADAGAGAGAGGTPSPLSLEDCATVVCVARKHAALVLAAARQGGASLKEVNGLLAWLVAPLAATRTGRKITPISVGPQLLAYLKTGLTGVPPPPPASSSASPSPSAAAAERATAAPSHKPVAVVATAAEPEPEPKPEPTPAPAPAPQPQAASVAAPAPVAEPESAPVAVVEPVAESEPVAEPEPAATADATVDTVETEPAVAKSAPVAPAAAVEPEVVEPEAVEPEAVKQQQQQDAVAPQEEVITVASPAASPVSAGSASASSPPVTVGASSSPRGGSGTGFGSSVSPLASMATFSPLPQPSPTMSEGRQSFHSGRGSTAAHSVSSVSGKRKPRARFTHFLSLRLQQDQAWERMRQLQDSIVALDERLKATVVDAKDMHLTIGLLAVGKDSDDIAVASQVCHVLATHVPAAGLGLTRCLSLSRARACACAPFRCASVMCVTHGVCCPPGSA